LANSAKAAKLKSPPNLNYYLEYMALYKYFRRVNKLRIMHLSILSPTIPLLGVPRGGFDPI